VIVTIFGRVGHHSTEKVRESLFGSGIGHGLIEQFDWARDPETCKDLPPYEDENGVHIPEMPAIRLVEEAGAETWVSGEKACLELIEGLLKR